MVLGERNELNLNDIAVIDFDRSVISSADWNILSDHAEIIVSVRILILMDVNDFSIDGERIFVFEVQKCFAIKLIREVSTFEICTFATRKRGEIFNCFL